MCLAGQRASVVYAGLSTSGTASCTALLSLDLSVLQSCALPARPPIPTAAAGHPRAAAVDASQLASRGRPGAAPDGTPCLRRSEPAGGPAVFMLRVQLGNLPASWRGELPWTAGVCLGIKAAPAMLPSLLSVLPRSTPHFEEHI